ncbi:MAG: Na(+)/H(+) antiporter subunit B [Bacteroidetes bacterium 47-18]|nr:MAG: Na(+)/H(+) antiporter subunit B [Bacteroidetes bacterium 47-18]
MKSTIFKVAANYLLPLLLLFSVFVLLRGHYESGGGFVGGLIASIAFVLHFFAYGLESARSFFRFSTATLIPIGLSISLFSGILPMFAGKPFMTSLWFKKPVAIIGSVGTPLFFDIGVYLIVVGVTLTILFTISENVK